MQEDRGPVRVHGPAIRYVRKAQGLGVAQLARAAGVSGPFVSMVEAGRRARVRPEVFDALVAELGVDPAVIRAHAGAESPAAA